MSAPLASRPPVSSAVTRDPPGPGVRPGSAIDPGGRNRAPGWWIPWLFIGGFGVVLAANLTLFVLATSTFSGLVSTRAYLDGLAYNREIAAQEAQDAMGWHGDLSLEVRPDRPADVWPAVLTADLRDGSGQPLSRLVVVARIVRPTQAGHDQVVTLAAGPDGRWRTPVTLGLPGQWEVRLIARPLDGDPQGLALRLRRRFLVAP